MIFIRSILKHRRPPIQYGLAMMGICMAALPLLGQTLPQLSIKTDCMKISYDSQTQRHLEWLSSGVKGSILDFDPSVQEGITVSGLACGPFRFEPEKSRQGRVMDPEFGAAWEAVVPGLFEDGERSWKIERTIRVLLPDEFPDVALFQSTYQNLSKQALHLDRIYSQRLLVNRQLAEPQARPFDFASFQGGAYKWGTEYALIRLNPEFKQSNFQGVDDVRGTEGVGGGMPFVDVWSPSMGVAIAHLEKIPQWLSLPVEVRPDRRVELAITENPLGKFGQKEWLKPGESYQTVLTAVIFHRLDYYDPLKTYGQLLRRRGVAIRESSPDVAFEPYWKSWGWMWNFTVEKILGKLSELKAMGIHVANLDMGWYDYMGDWDLDRSPGKFPGGEPDMVALVQKLHTEGFRSSFWWYPLGVSPESRLARDHKDLLVRGENGEYPADINSFYQLCPGYEPALDYLRQRLTRAVKVWGFDGVYSDYQGLSAVPACFNPAHKHKSPLDSFQSVPKLFEMIDKTLHELKKDPIHEVCICSLPHSPYAMPFYDVANASDPVSTLQVRSRIKVEKAIRGGRFAVGDCYQVPIQEWTGYSVPESFESAIGTGAQLTTFYTQLDERQLSLWNRWFHEYRELDLSRAEYLNLYDLAFDKPEIHVVRKGGDLYFGIYADVWPRDKYKIELRGLEKNRDYQVYDYANRKELGIVKGSEPFLNIGFKDSLLLRVRPATIH